MQYDPNLLPTLKMRPTTRDPQMAGQPSPRCCHIACLLRRSNLMLSHPTGTFLRDTHWLPFVPIAQRDTPSNHGAMPVRAHGGCSRAKRICCCNTGSCLIVSGHVACLNTGPCLSVPSATRCSRRNAASPEEHACGELHLCAKWHFGETTSCPE